jgi:hypothetical protein
MIPQKAIRVKNGGSDKNFCYKSEELPIFPDEII